MFQSRSWQKAFILLTILMVLLAAANILLFAAWQYRQFRWPIKYSYIGNDHPGAWAIAEKLPAVALTPEDSVHYHAFSPQAAAEWDSPFPYGGGFLFLGPHYQEYGTSLFHQMHCLGRLRNAVVDHNPGDGMDHVAHCFHYLRQMVLCRSDLQLEPVDLAVGPTAIDSNVLHTCRDWSMVFSKSAESAREWENAGRPS